MDAEYSSDFLERYEYVRDDTIVDAMTYDKLGKMLKKLNMEITPKPEEDRLKLKQRLFGGPWTQPFSQIKDGLNETVQTYKDLKQRLIQESSDLIATVENQFFRTNMSKVANKRFPDYEKELKDIKTMLQSMTDEFEIAFIGETSSGKSTFLNVLLGGNVLPSDHLHTTASLCRLHYSENRKISYTDENNIVREIQLTADSSQLRSMLDTINQDFLSNENDDEPLKIIDVYWPIPSLHGNVVLTDTPGLGERDLLTKKISEYVPKCAGYVFIIDSASAGGVRSCLKKMFQMIKKYSSNENHEMDFSNSIFVCNKWDHVRVRDRKKVLNDTKQKLKGYFERLDDWQILQINAKLELKLIEWKANSAGDFKMLQESLNSLMIRTIEKRLKDVCRGLKTFANRVAGFFDDVIEGVNMSKEELQKNLKVIEDKIDLARKHLKQFKEVEKMVRIEENLLLHALQKHLETVQRNVLNWTNFVPLLNDVDDDGPKQIVEHIQDVMFEWVMDKTGSLKQASNRIKNTFQGIQTEIDSRISDIQKTEQGLWFVDVSDQHLRISGKSSVLSLIRHNVWEMAARIFKWIGRDSSYSWAHDKATQASKQRSIEKMTAMTSKAIKMLLAENQLRIFITDFFTSPHINWLTEFKEDTEKILDSEQEIAKMKQNLNMDEETLVEFNKLKTKFNESANCLQDLENDI